MVLGAGIFELGGKGSYFFEEGFLGGEGIAGVGFGEGDAGDVGVGVWGCEEVIAGLIKVSFDLFFGGFEGNLIGCKSVEFLERVEKGGLEVRLFEVESPVGAVFVFVAGLEGGEGGFEVGDVGLVGGLCGGGLRKEVSVHAARGC